MSSIIITLLIMLLMRELLPVSSFLICKSTPPLMFKSRMVVVRHDVRYRRAVTLPLHMSATSIDRLKIDSAPYYSLNAQDIEQIRSAEVVTDIVTALGEDNLIDLFQMFYEYSKMGSVFFFPRMLFCLVLTRMY